MNDLLKRSLTGIVYVLAIFIGILIHPIVFAIIFGALLYLVLSEYFNLFKETDFYPQKWITTGLGLALFLICFGALFGLISQQFVLLFIPIIILVVLFEIFNKKGNSLINAALSLFGFIYIVAPFCFMAFLIYPDFPESREFNPWILAGIFLIIWISDSMAYVGGSLLGKRKLAKSISPKKSWEGLIVGAVFAIIMGILNAVLFQGLSMLNWIIIAVIAVVFGTFGDLFESKIKRSLNIKDSGTVLPGHGGFLDRFDSVLFAVPVIYIWLVFAGNI